MIRLVDLLKEITEGKQVGDVYKNSSELSKIGTEEEYSEQKDRMKQGLIPSLNDLGAIDAAQKTLRMYGDEG